MSAIESFKLIGKHFFKFVLVNGFTHLFSWVGSIFICLGNLVVSYLLLTAIYPGLNSQITPLAAIAFLTLITTHVFFGVFDIATDTILHCFILDMDLQHQLNGHDNVYPPHFLVKFHEINTKMNAE
jgi:hypothetical protein